MAGCFAPFRWKFAQAKAGVVYKICKRNTWRNEAEAETMSEEKTKALKTPSLLEKILTKLEVMDTRLQLVESKIEERGFDTRPIWEKALLEIMEVNQRVGTIDRKIDVFSRDMLNLRA
jgi:hypothetical protein